MRVVQQSLKPQFSFQRQDTFDNCRGIPFVDDDNVRTVQLFVQEI